MPQGNGDFLVKRRFQMPLGDLVARANRMRIRQRKPEFEMIGVKTGPEEVFSSNGHPLFWKESTPAQPRS